MMTSASSAAEIVVKAREPAPPRQFLPDPSDMVAIAHAAQQFTSHATIRYQYDGEPRELRVFPGGWWDGPVRR